MTEMSPIALQGLLEYLYGTLTPQNMRWVADHLISQADLAEAPAPQRLTMEEVNAMIAEAEADIVAGRVTLHDEVMRQWEEDIARREREEHEMAKVG